MLQIYYPESQNWHEYLIYLAQKELITLEEDIMKKKLQIIIISVFVVLLTATFSFAEYTASGVNNFPYFQLGCLIIGGMTIISLKHKYQKIHTAELISVFSMYTMLIALFTAPVINVIKTMVS